MKASKSKRLICTAVVMLFVSGLAAGPASSAGTGGLKPLSSVPVPLPPANILSQYIIDTQAAIQLGKALFWDAQLGSDGVMACASCHWSAGADTRASDIVNPGRNQLFQAAKPGATVLAKKFFIKTDDIAGSGGVLDMNFLGLSNPLTAVDNVLPIPDPLFKNAAGNVRQCTGRNAPSSVNAVYNLRNFYDGRASNNFNGVTPSGTIGGAQNAFVYKIINGVPHWVSVSIPNASTASQAVGPPLSAVEMSAAGRTWPDIGRKMIGLGVPLAQQVVDPTDSVLGSLANPGGTGLATTYSAMIAAAFDPQWYSDALVAANGWTVTEANFSLIFGLSVMLYEATLVSDQTPLDQFLLGNAAALTPTQQAGMQVYIGKARCNKCHGGAELTEAAVSQAKGDLLKGFLNTAVRPLREDGGDVLQPGQGKFKTPGLRNNLLNGPYFHNGGMSTLMQVVDFYDRGGDFPSQFTDSDVRPLRLTPVEKNALVDFLAYGMLDNRVARELPPFDHPALVLPNGPTLPAVGAAGNAAPLQPFLGLSPFIP
ncbi:MAG: cytochrome c peroxidase [Syntrophobacteraceae bacterium]